MESRKRKREADEPRIKYHVKQSGRSFERILKENSREELCEVVRKKLNLDSNTPLELVQIREGVVYDLEDDEDFEAFKAAAFAYSSLDVHVSISTDVFPENASSNQAGADSSPRASGEFSSPRKERRKKLKKRFSLGDRSIRDQSVDTGRSLSVVDNDGRGMSQPIPALPSASDEIAAPPKKKRKKDHVKSDTEIVEERALAAKRGKTKLEESAILSRDSVVPVEDMDQEPPKKKQKKGKGKEKESIPSEVEEVQVPAANPSGRGDAGETKSKKSKPKKISASTLGNLVQNSNDVADQSTKIKSKKTSITGQNGRSVSLRSPESPIPVDASSNTVPPPAAICEKSLSRVSASDNLQGSPDTFTSDPVRLTFASFLRRPPRSAEEMLATYSGPDIDEVSEGNHSPESNPMVEEAVASATVKTKTGATKKDNDAGMTAKKSAGRDQSRTKPGRSRLREGWIPAEVEKEDSVPPAEPQPSGSGSVQVSEAITQSLSVIHRPPRRSEKKQVPSKPQTNPKVPKSASPCPVCLSLPFHFRFKCPLITSGVGAILKRIAELKTESGQGDLILELEAWVQKEQKKEQTKALARQETSRAKEPSLPAAAPKPDSPVVTLAESRHRDSPLPSWTPILPLESQPSEVTVEDHNEGSESASSSSDREGTRIRSKSPSETSSSSSSTDPESTTLSVNLNNVDLNTLIRGPSLKAIVEDLAKLDNENEDVVKRLEDNEGEEGEDNVGVLEEEEEEPIPKRPKGLGLRRSSSPEAMHEDDDDQSDSASGSGMEMVSEGDSSHVFMHECHAIDVEPPVLVEEVTDDNAERPVETKPPLKPSEPQALAANTDPQKDRQTSRSASEEVSGDGGVVSEVSADLTRKNHASNAPFSSLVETPSHQGLTEPDALPQVDGEPNSSILRATTPTRLNVPHLVPNTPSTIQRMKGRDGHLPLNTPEDDIGIGLPATPPVTQDIFEVTSPVAQDESSEKLKRTRAISQPKSTTKESRSVTAPISVRSTSTDGAPSASQPGVKRRGRPPLTDAVKAERKAIKDAEKAAKAAERRAKAEEEKAAKATEKRAKATNTSRQPRKRKGESEAEPSRTPQASSPSPAALPTSEAAADFPTPFPASQWKTLPSVAASSTVQSSPALDQLVSSSQPDDIAGDIEAGRSSPAPVVLNGIKSPGGLSMASGSRKHDEDDVEQIVGSSEASKIGPPTRQPLFLPGASQMTQSQFIPPFLALSSDRPIQESRVERNRSPSGSSSHTDPGSDEERQPKPMVPRPQVPSKSAFPSLSQLSFDKFRPSFLMGSRAFNSSQNKEKESAVIQPDDNSDSEEDESSDDEHPKSRIPKDRRAGAGVVKKRKSRGLLQI